MGDPSPLAVFLLSWFPWPRSYERRTRDPLFVAEIHAALKREQSEAEQLAHALAVADALLAEPKPRLTIPGDRRESKNPT